MFVTHQSTRLVDYRKVFAIYTVGGQLSTVVNVALGNNGSGERRVVGNRIQRPTARKISTRARLMHSYIATRTVLTDSNFGV